MAISKIGSKALVDCSVAAVDIEDNSITSAKLAGSIANAKLANSSITVNGTSVSLGASGSIPAVSWQSVVTADGSTATSTVAGNGYFIDTTSAAHTITLPSSPSAGDTVAIKDYAGTFGSNNLTIARNSSNIQGAANDSLISTNRASLTLVYVDATKGWLYTVESNVADLEKVGYTSATGGTVTTSGDYKYHVFTGDGCFVVSTAAFGPSCATNTTYLVVAGGGGGGWDGGGGGGAGGLRTGNVTTTATTYPITVGAGGTAGGPARGQNPAGNGGNSIFSTITSTGGGGGANVCAAGDPGGSGGGGGQDDTGNGPFAGGTGNTPPVSPSQGNDGGTTIKTPSGNASSSGGGGSTVAGGNGRPQSCYPSYPQASPGGVALGGAGTDMSPSFPTPLGGSPAGFYAGGGSGGGYLGCGEDRPGGPAVPGGGGAGGTPAGDPGCAGVANTGGGGGGGAGAVGNGSTGGKGIVIIRYKYQ